MTYLKVTIPFLSKLLIHKLNFHWIHNVLGVIVKRRMLVILMHIWLFCYHRTTMNKMLIILRKLQVSCFWGWIQTNVWISILIIHSVTLWIEWSTLMALIHHHSLVLETIRWKHRIANITLHIWSYWSLENLLLRLTMVIVSIRRWSFVKLMVLDTSKIFFIAVFIVLSRVMLCASNQFWSWLKFTAVSSRGKSNLKLL